MIQPGGSLPWVSWELWSGRPICLRLLLHDIRRAASRADCTAAKSSATSRPMIAITTNSSTSVKPRDGNHRVGPIGVNATFQVIRIAGAIDYAFRQHMGLARHL